MGSVVEEFVIALGLDPSGVSKGSQQVRDDLKHTRQAANAMAGDMGSSAKHAANAFAGLRNEVAGLLLAVAGANSVKDFVSQMIVGEASSGRMAANLNLGVGRLMGWQRAMRSVGGSSGDADQALSQIQQIFMNRQMLGDTSKDSLLAHLGITDISQLQDSSEGLFKLSEAASRLSKQDFTWSMSQLGINQNTINLLERGRDRTEKLVREQERQADVTQDDIRAAQELQAKLADLSTLIQAKARPYVSSFADALSSVLTNTNQMNAATPVMIGLLGSLGATALAAYGPFALLAAAIAASVVAYRDWKRLHDMSPEDRKKFDDRGAQLRARAWDQLKSGDFSGFFGTWGEGFMERVEGRDGPAQSVPVHGSVSAGSGDRVSRAQAFFKANGFSDDQARGIVAAMLAEDPGLDPTTRGPLTKAGHRAYGIGQWLSADRIQQFQRLTGKSLYSSTFDEQLRFFLWELRNTHKLAGMTAAASGGAVGAGTAVINGFYAPGPGTAGDVSRMLGFLRQTGAGQMNVGTVIVQLPGVKNAQEFTRQLPAATRRKALAAQAQSGISG